MCRSEEIDYQNVDVFGMTWPSSDKASLLCHLLIFDFVIQKKNKKNSREKNFDACIFYQTLKKNRLIIF